jgi:hypothetical protein
LLLFVGAAATGELRREIFQSIKIDFAKKKKKKKKNYSAVTNLLRTNAAMSSGN